MPQNNLSSESLRGTEGIQFQASLLALGAAIEIRPPGSGGVYRPAMENLRRLSQRAEAHANLELISVRQ